MAVPPVTRLLAAAVLLTLTLHLHTANGQAVCSSLQFTCNNKRCIPISWICDGENDCGDKSDELTADCPEHESCDDSQFRCKDGRCIIARWQCDGDEDCRDGSDEDPHVCVNRTCAGHELRCGNDTAAQCVPIWWQCDGVADCQDGADELDCPSRTCDDHQFACKNSSGECVPITWLCDGAADCGDASDEANCTQTCPSDQFTCADGKCINSRWVCDRDEDCDDGSDEHNCQIPTCNPETQFTCGSGECIGRTSRCDGDRDCHDDSDEQGCMPSQPLDPVCTEPDVACADQVTCIHRRWLCDGDRDCADGSDEDPAKCSPPACEEDQHQCGGLGECISRNLVCNGARDCRDGSDELNCTEVKPSCDSEDEFSCTNGRCVAIALACDDADDCGDGSDESALCQQNECAQQNGGCSHGCQNRPVGYRCFCPLGYRLMDDRKTCDDVDECQIPGSCSQMCINEKGSFKCECLEGYQRDPAQHTFCKAIEVHASLLLTHRTDIRKVGLYQREMTSIVNGTRTASAVDYEFRTGMVYWSDVGDKRIYRAPIDEGTRREVVVRDVMAEGIAVDWLYRHLYWIQVGKGSSSLEVASLGGEYRATVVDTGLLQPRSIAVDPVHGWMYWSDWGSQPRIERSGMDGSHRETIVDTRVEWPNGITLDLVKRRVFWVDAKLKLIESADLDGSNRLIVISNPQILHHPFSITTFEDSIYWTDWDKMSVFKANKFTGAGVTSVAPTGKLQFPVEVRVYHPYRQPNATNYCLPINGQCSHVCLPAPQLPGSSRRTGCACPAGLTLGPDRLTCREQGNGTTLLSYFTPAREAPPARKPTVPTLTVPHVPRHSTESFGHSIQSVEENVALFSAITTTPRPSGSVELKVTPSQDDGVIAGVVIGSILFLLVILGLLGYIIYRQCPTKGFRNFDNPIYKKTTVDAISLDKSRSPVLPSRGNEESLQPLTRPQLLV